MSQGAVIASGEVGTATGPTDTELWGRGACKGSFMGGTAESTTRELYDINEICWSE